MKTRHLTALLFGLVPLAGAAAQPDGPRSADEPGRSAGIDIFASSDADHSNAVKLGASYDFAYTDLEHHQGVRLEEFIFATRGSRTTTQERGYFTFADAGARWKWNGSVGTDGHNLLGSGSIYVDEDFRQEYFVSRDLIETPLGVTRGVYSTFVGAAYDLPLDERNTVTALVGVQDFGGENKRIHLRARYIYAIAPEWGLSVQLRTRYFWNSVPRELDYFSPRWYFEAVPTIQLRRFYNRWQYIAAFGWGVRQDGGSQWQSAVQASASVTSPKFGQDWHMKAELTYSNMPVSAGYTYNYEQVVVSIFKRF